MSSLGSNKTSIWGLLFSYLYMPPKVPRVTWTQSKHSWAFLEWSTEWNLESKREFNHKKPSNVDFRRSTIDRQGFWTQQPNLRRCADLKKTWACSFPLFHLKCFLVREPMKSDPSNLRGLSWRQRWHQETKLNSSEQRFHQQARLWLTCKQWLPQHLENPLNVQPAIQLWALDQQMWIDKQQEKVTDNKQMKVLQQQPMKQYLASLKLSGSQPRKR